MMILESMEFYHEQLMKLKVERQKIEIERNFLLAELEKMEA